MPRPFPWLSRVSEIRRAVSNSVRSHYSRRELEILFRSTPRAAGRLLELLATERIGTAHMVSREELARFLDRVTEAEDVAELCGKIRDERANLTRVKARYLLARDEHEVPVASLPEAIQLEPGQLTVRFESIEELCERLLQISQAMKDDPIAFEARCEVRKPVLSAEAEEARFIDAEIERMKAEQAA